MKTVKTTKITLQYVCPECNEMEAQLLVGIVQNGTLICEECQCDMDLADTVRIED
jgi:transcription elongation factor Elf1